MLTDPRIEKLAAVLLKHSLALEPGDIFLVNASISAKPLVEAIYRLSEAMAVFPVIRWHDEEIGRLNYNLLTPKDPSTDRFLQAGNRWLLEQLKDVTAILNIRGTDNDREMDQIPKDKLQLVAKANESSHRQIIDERKWALYYWPTPAQAQQAGMSTGDYIDFVLSVSLVDYDRLHEAEQRLAQLLEASDQVHVVAPGTDLKFSIKGMPAVCCYGRRNIPDGEVYIAPLIDSANGRITYNVPTNFWGKSFKNISFEFRQGKIVKASCDGDRGALENILDSDDGARRLGEFSFGVNPQLKHPVGSILFDEKITGSIHLTPGQAYAKSDNGNQSMIHWDLIQIQRPDYGGGEVWIDGQLIRKDGIFLPEDLQDLNP